MNDRRSLLEGLKQTPTVDPKLEQDFVYQTKGISGEGPLKSPIAQSPSAAPPTARAPLSTRIRADMASALKRASLERQLSGTAPHTLQDILEEAIEPWLKTHGYLS